MKIARTLRHLLPCSALVLVPRSVHARDAPTPIEVVQRESEALDCPDSPQLASEVERILQRPLSDSGAATGATRIEVRFSRTRDGYSASLTFRGRKPGERTLQDRGQQCGALAQAVSVTIALFLDKELAEEEAVRAAEPSPTTVAAPGRTSTRKEQLPSPYRATAKAFQTHAALGGGAGWFASNGPQAMLALELGASVEPWSLDLGLAQAFPATSRFGSGQVSTRLLLGSARACYRLGARVSFGPCAAFGLGSLRGRGDGFAETRSVGLLWSAVGVGAHLEAQLGARAFLAASGLGWWPTRRQTFSVENAGVAWKSAPVAGTLLVNFGLRVW